MPPTKHASKASSKSSSKSKGSSASSSKDSLQPASTGPSKPVSTDPSKPTSKVASKVTSKAVSKAGSVKPSMEPAERALSDDVRSPANLAMEELRSLKFAAMGLSPVSQFQSDVICGRHVQSMLAACLGPCAAGTTLGFASAAMASIESEPWYGLEQWPPQNRWFADLALIGAAVGALLSGVPLRFLGSRTTLLVCALGLSLSWAVLAACAHLYVLLGARVACGVCLGVTSIGASLYVVDVAPTEKKDFYAGLAEVGTSAGIFVSYMLSLFPWRLQAGVCAAVPLALLYARRYIFESPRWLLNREMRDEAVVSACQLYGLHVPPDLRPITKTPASIAVSPQRSPRARRLLLCLLLQLLREAACAELVLYRAIQTIDGIVADMMPAVAAVVIAALHVASAAAVAALTRVTGRWNLLFVSTLLVAFCVAIVAPFDYLVFRRWSLMDRTAQQGSSTSWSVVYSVNLLVLGYSVGLCHLPPLLTAELCSEPDNTLRYVVAPVAWAIRWMLAGLLLHFDEKLAELARLKLAPAAMAIALLLLAVYLMLVVPVPERRNEAQP